jgi:formate dehydrogenase accessory protein FdhD
LLTALGDDTDVGGLGVVRAQVDDERTTLWLTPAGRLLCQSPLPSEWRGGLGRGEAGATNVAAERTPLATADTLRIDGTTYAALTDTVITETPVALLYNGLAFAVMLATPCDLEDFALGFSLSEGIVASAGDWRLLDRLDHADGISLDMAIPQADADALAQRRRGLAGRSGCGLCGVESLQAALPPVPVVPAREPVPVSAIRAALAGLAAQQPLNQASGGVHAAAFAHPDGLLVREDVGRHNALDKVLGARARAGFGDGFLVVTSRASVELVHKAATCGIGLLVAISAPTSLAIRLAHDAGVTLVAFARGEAMTVYSHPQGIE